VEKKGLFKPRKRAFLNEVKPATRKRSRRLGRLIQIKEKFPQKRKGRALVTLPAAHKLVTSFKQESKQGDWNSNSKYHKRRKKRASGSEVVRLVHREVGLTRLKKIRFYRKREVCGQPGKSVVKDVRAFPNSYHIEPKMGTRFRWTKNRLKTTIYAWCCPTGWK